MMQQMFLGLGGAPDVKASGGSIAEPGNGFVYHVFIANGNFQRTVDSLSAVDYLVVAGGGGGGDYYGAGGGAGGYRTHSPNGGPLQPAGAITVGASAIAVTVGDGATTNKAKGSNSSFGVISSEGGGGGESGGGAGGGGNVGTTGGSGGGGGPANGGGTHAGFAGNTPAVNPPQGNPGGTGYHLGTYPAGGGGGAGAPGGSAGNNSGAGGPGGNGYPNPDFAAPLIAPALTAASVPSPQVTAFTNAIGPTGLYAGGGAGASGSGGQGAGGPGGGGATTTPGVEYTGGGGGGQHPPAGSWDGQGGKGIVIVRYAA